MWQNSLPMPTTCNKMKFNLFLVSTAVFLFFACQNSNVSKEEISSQNKHSDSISIQLNSKELKWVNGELVGDPNNPELYNKRAKIYLGLEQLEEALADCKLVLKLDSTEAAYYLTLIDVYFAQNNTRLAKETLLKVEKKFPENTETLLKLAELYYLVRQYQNAITYVNKALKIDESLAKGYYLKGSIYRESGDTSLAISSLETAIEQDNRFEDAFYDLGVVYAARKNPLALQYYTNTLRINPDNQNALYARARYYQSSGETEKAIIEYKNMVSKVKSCDQCYYNLGAIYFGLKNNPDLAIDYFTKAIEVNPNYLEAYFARAFTYAKQKNNASAKADYNMCLKLQPDYEDAINGLNELD